jgi:hypothetical protein
LSDGLPAGQGAEIGAVWWLGDWSTIPPAAMKTLSTTLLVLCLALIAAAVPAHAFDSRHKGFLFGVGLGGGGTFFNSKSVIHDLYAYDSLYYYREFHSQGSAGAVGTDFRVGWGVTDRLLIHYDNRVSWFTNEGATIASGLTNLRLSYFVSPKVYVTVGPGIASWSFPFESGVGGYTGGGVLVGSGWEFRPHWLLEGTFMSGKPTEEALEYKTDTNTSSILLTIDHLWY